MKTISSASRNLPKCCFCVHWNDSLNRHIRVASKDGTVWRYNEIAECECRLMDTKTTAVNVCDNFISKI